jgi:GTP cyclohydrolase III
MNNNIEKYDFKKIVEKHVNNTNLKIKTLEGSNSKLFGAVKKAIDAFNGDKKSLKLYRQQLESNHRSTISMMIRVAKNDLIRQHETKLPTSYQTLNELIKLIN